MTRPRRTRPLLVTIAAIVVASIPASAQSTSSPFGGGAERGGRLETAGVPLPGRTVWEVQTQGPVRSSPVVSEGVVYVGSHDGHLYAIRLADGDVLWRYDVGEPITAAAVVAGDVVVVNDRLGNMHAVGRSDGGRRWIDRAGEPLSWAWGLEGWDYTGSTPAYADGTVVAGGSDGRVRAIDVASGTRLWTVETGGPVRSSPAISNGVVYVGSADGVVRALDLASGSEAWSFETRGAALNSADFGFDRRTISGGPAVRDGRVYIGSRDARMYALDASDGSEVWVNDDDGTSAWIISTPALTDELVLFGRSSSAKVQAVDRLAGTVAWEVQLDGLVFSSAALVGDLAYLTTGPGTLVALESRTGRVVWERRLGGASWSSPTVADGIVVVGADDGIVRAIGAAEHGQPRLAVYYDSATATPSLSNGRGQARRVTDALVRGGFEEVSGAALLDWLAAATSVGVASTIVLATDVLPDEVAPGGAPSGPLADYMESGGRVVWFSVPPFWLRFDADGAADVDLARTERFLGVDFGRWVSDSRMQTPTPAGRAWGLGGWWTGEGGIDPAEVTTVLVTDEEGGASGWVKSFGGPHGSGWVHLPYAPGAEWLEGLRRVAEWGVTRAP